MILDGILLDRICSSLKDKLTFARIQRIRQINNKSFVFDISSIKNNKYNSGTLFLSFEGQKSFIALSPDKNICNESKLKSFGAFLRKHVQSSIITEIRNYPYERIIEMIIEKRNEIGDIEVKHLVMEFIGARSNLVVCDENLIILDSLTHYEKKNEKDRELMPARKYYLPHRDEKLSPKSLLTMPNLLFDSFSHNKYGLSYDEENLIDQSHLTVQNINDDKKKDLYSYLLSRIDGLSKYLLLNILSYTKIDPDTKIVELSSKDKDELLEKLNKILFELFQDENCYFIYKNKLIPAVKNELITISTLFAEGKLTEALDIIKCSYYLSEDSSLPEQIHLCHNPNYSDEITFNNICDAFSIYLNIKLKVQELHNVRKIASDLIKKEIKKLEKKLVIHKSEYSSCGDLEEDQRKGQLIYANLASLQNYNKNKTSQIELVDYYSENLETVKIEIDNRYSLQENAARFLKQYNKKLTRSKIMREMIQDEEDLLSLANESLIYISNASSESEIEEITDDFYDLYEKINAKNRQRNKKSDTESLNLGNSKSSSKSSKNKHKMQINIASNSGNKRKRLKQALKLHESKQKQNKKKIDKNSTSLPPMEFVMQNGTSIMVGRNAKQNERLSLRDANKNFLWFHIKNTPGTHVILCKDYDKVTNEEIELAASLCAYFSSPKEMRAYSNKVEIDYCKVSNLKKAKSSKPGMLIYDDFNSVYITAMSPSQLGLKIIG